MRLEIRGIIFLVLLLFNSLNFKQKLFCWFLKYIYKLLNIEYYIVWYFRFQSSKSSSKRETKSQVLEIGKNIETWVNSRKPELTTFLEFTNRACDIVKQKTDIDLPLIVANVFVGVGNMIVNSHDKVFHVLV